MVVSPPRRGPPAVADGARRTVAADGRRTDLGRGRDEALPGDRRRPSRWGEIRIPSSRLRLPVDNSWAVDENVHPGGGLIDEELTKGVTEMNPHPAVA
ncbi:hypothetical protein ATKI12_2074 [Kitasatospora sp. Ki12]